VRDAVATQGQSEVARPASGHSTEAGLAALRRMLTPGASGGRAHAPARHPSTAQSADAREPALTQGASGYQTVSGSLYASENAGEPDISPLDITQGGLNDCWLLSGMAAIARENPELIRRLIKDNGDGAYDVTLYGPENPDPNGDWSNKTAHVIHVDNRIPTAQGATTAAYAQGGNARGKTTTLPGDASVELWPMILEKAVAIYLGGYTAMDSGGGVGVGLDLLTSGAATEVDMSTVDHADVLKTFSLALAAHQGVTAVSAPQFAPESLKHADELGVVAWHVYSVKSVDVQAQTISLQNPWGRQDLDGLSAADFFTFYTWYSIGAAS